MSTGELEIGRVVADKYRVERVIGRGGMGTVYAVSHVVTGKRLALKCLLPHFVAHPGLVERFLREAKLAGRIQHRHVIDVFDVGRDGTVLYMVMPLLEGRPLSMLLVDRLTAHDGLLILLRAMDGVAAAHALGIVHRDLKPANIFVCLGVSGQLDDPRVLDFGISKLDEESDTLTGTGVVLGTPTYMSLEQLRGSRQLDQRVDVYAMGVILYETFAGEPPYRAENPVSLAMRIMTEQPRPLHVLRPDLPTALCASVMRALARDPADRPASMQALRDDLRPFLDSADLTLPAPSSSAAPAFALEATHPQRPADVLRATPSDAQPTTPTRPAAAEDPPGAELVSLKAPEPDLRMRRLRMLGLALAVCSLAFFMVRLRDVDAPPHSDAPPRAKTATSAGNPPERPPATAEPAAAPAEAIVLARDAAAPARADSPPDQAAPSAPRPTQRRLTVRLPKRNQTSGDAQVAEPALEPSEPSRAADAATEPPPSPAAVETERAGPLKFEQF